MKRRLLHTEVGDRILICNPVQTLGDTVLTSAFINTLLKNYPEGAVDLIATTSVREYYEEYKNIDNIYYIPNWIRKKRVLFYRIPFSYKFVKENFANKSYKYIFLPRLNSDPLSIFICYLISHKTIVRFSTDSIDLNKSIIEYKFDLLSEVNLFPKKLAIHEADAQNYLLTSLGYNYEREKPKHWIAVNKDVALEKNIVIAIGSSAKRRKLSIKRLIQLISILDANYEFPIIVIGGNEDHDDLMNIEIKFKSKIITNYGKYTMTGYLEYINNKTVVIGYDSGITHLLSIDAYAVIVLSPHPKNGSSVHSNSPVRFSPINMNCIIIQNENICSNGCTESCLSIGTNCMDMIDHFQIVDSIRNYLV